MGVRLFRMYLQLTQVPRVGSPGRLPQGGGRGRAERKPGVWVPALGTSGAAE